MAEENQAELSKWIDLSKISIDYDILQKLKMFKV